MTFPSAAGYGNLPQGNWSPVIYSKMVQLAFRKTAVCNDITNSDYTGEIEQFGDTVNIIKEPNIEVKTYVRGQGARAQDLDDDELVLIIDKANSFSFRVNDIEKKQSHIDWETKATDTAAYALRDKFDQEILSYMAGYLGTDDGELDLSGHKIGAAGSPVDIVTDGTKNGTTVFSPLSIINRFERLLDEQDVPAEGRWFVAGPVFYEMLGDEDSKFINNDTAEKGVLRNGRVSMGQVRGFTMYRSNSLPKVGAGAAGTTTGDHSIIMAGHISSTASAEQMNIVETIRDGDDFADLTRGLHLYGRKVLRSEALVGAYYHSKA